MAEPDGTQIDNGAPIPTVPAKAADIIGKAMRSGEVEQIIRWVESGGNLDWRTANGWTLLHLAAQSGSTNMVSFLLAHGADIESRDERDETPLILACDDGYVNCMQNPSVVELLLENGADPNARDCDGMTALRLIRQCGSEDARRIGKLLEAGGTRLIPGENVQCPECGAPNGPSMLQRDVHATITGETFAVFSCKRCGNRTRFPRSAISKEPLHSPRFCSVIAM